MEIYSIQFLLLLVAALLIYYTIGKKHQWICLLVVSALFYLWTGGGNLCFILVTGITTWAGARWLDRLAGEYAVIKKNKEIDPAEKKGIKAKYAKKRRIIMFAVVILNFGILAYLKYWNDIFGTRDALGLVLPLGISFYTFQSMGYLLDVYNEKYSCETNPAKFMLFVSFFPQMIQGPINRYDQMRDQFFTEHSIDFEKAERAVYRIFYGLFKKYAIANILAPVIAAILDNEAGRNIPGSVIVIGILLYSIQQYADFSGGIDMVMGIAQLFGIEMMPNFRQPYFSTSLAEFWRRWHISLGKWMRDYVFYPFALTKPIKNLGKWANNKLGKHMGRVLPAMLGNILVFFIVGIWHGAQMHYVVWGLYNGIVIALSDLLAPVYSRLNEALHINTQSKAFYVFQVIRTFIVVNIGWYFDRIEDMGLCMESLVRTVTDFQIARMIPVCIAISNDFSRISIALALLATVFVFFVSVLEERKIDVYEYLHKKPLVLRWGIYYMVIVLILLSFFSVPDAAGFMYANF
ncbi:MAG: MBOAT family protein [Roseburia sp.]|nr:MBOAT family protein [Roseburia sp.]